MGVFGTSNSSIAQQISVGAATGTLSDVVGLDGSWVNDFAKQETLLK